MLLTCTNCDLPYERPDAWKPLPKGAPPMCIPCRDSLPGTPTVCGYCDEDFMRPVWWKPLRPNGIACCFDPECRAKQSAARVVKHRTENMRRRNRPTPEPRGKTYERDELEIVPEGFVHTDGVTYFARPKKKA